MGSPAKLDQWVYAACQLGSSVSDSAGYQTFNYSRELPKEVDQELVEVTRFWPGKEVKGKEGQPPQQQPNRSCFGIRRLKSNGQWCIFRSAQAKDEINRRTYFAHALLIENIEDLPHPPFAYFDSEDFLELERRLPDQTKSTVKPPLLDPIPAAALRVGAELAGFKDPRDWVHREVEASQLRLDRVKALAGALNENDRNAILSPEEAPARVLLIFAALWLFWEARQRERLSLCTVLPEANVTPFAIAGWPASLGRPTDDFAHRFSVVFMGWDAPRGDLVVPDDYLLQRRLTLFRRMEWEKLDGPRPTKSEAGLHSGGGAGMPTPEQKTIADSRGGSLPAGGDRIHPSVKPASEDKPWADDTFIPDDFLLEFQKERFSREFLEALVPKAEFAVKYWPQVEREFAEAIKPGAAGWLYLPALRDLLGVPGPIPPYILVNFGVAIEKNAHLIPPLAQLLRDSNSPAWRSALLENVKGGKDQLAQNLWEMIGHPNSLRIWAEEHTEWAVLIFLKCVNSTDSAVREKAEEILARLADDLPLESQRLFVKNLLSKKRAGGFTFPEAFYLGIMCAAPEKEKELFQRIEENFPALVAVASGQIEIAEKWQGALGARTFPNLNAALVCARLCPEARRDEATWARALRTKTLPLQKADEELRGELLTLVVEMGVLYHHESAPSWVATLLEKFPWASSHPAVLRVLESLKPPLPPPEEKTAPPELPPPVKPIAPPVNQPPPEPDPLAQTDVDHPPRVEETPESDLLPKEGQPETIQGEFELASKADAHSPSDAGDNRAVEDLQDAVGGTKPAVDATDARPGSYSRDSGPSKQPTFPRVVPVPAATDPEGTPPGGTPTMETETVEATVRPTHPKNLTEVEPSRRKAPEPDGQKNNPSAQPPTTAEISPFEKRSVSDSQTNKPGGSSPTEQGAAPGERTIDVRVVDRLIRWWNCLGHTELIPEGAATSKRWGRTLLIYACAVVLVFALAGPFRAPIQKKWQNYWESVTPWTPPPKVPPTPEPTPDPGKKFAALEAQFAAALANAKYDEADAVILQMGKDNMPEERKHKCVNELNDRKGLRIRKSGDLQIAKQALGKGNFDSAKKVTTDGLPSPDNLYQAIETFKKWTADLEREIKALEKQQSDLTKNQGEALASKEWAVFARQWDDLANAWQSMADKFDPVPSAVAKGLTFAKERGDKLRKLADDPPLGNRVQGQLSKEARDYIEQLRDATTQNAEPEPPSVLEKEAKAVNWARDLVRALNKRNAASFIDLAHFVAETDPLILEAESALASRLTKGQDLLVDEATVKQLQTQLVRDLKRAYGSRLTEDKWLNVSGKIDMATRYAIVAYQMANGANGGPPGAVSSKLLEQFGIKLKVKTNKPPQP